MSSFPVDGFLSEGIQSNITAQIEKTHCGLWQDARDVSHFAQWLQGKLEVKARGPEALSAVLYARTLSTYQAFLINYTFGMEDQAMMLERCMMESVFRLVAIAKDQNFADRIVKDLAFRSRNLAISLINYHDENRNIAELKSARQVLKDFDCKFSGVQQKSLSVAESARKAGLRDWYLTNYSSLSDTIHASAISLFGHVVLGDTHQDIEEFKNEPSIENFMQLTTGAIELMLYALGAMSNVCDEKTKQCVKKMQRKIKLRLHNYQPTFGVPLGSESN